MKHLFILLLMYFVHFVHAQPDVRTPDLSIEQLKGNVFSVLEKQVSIAQDSSRTDIRHIYTEYNKDGQQVLYKFVHHVADNKFSKTVRKFNAAKKLEQVDMFENEKPVEKRMYEYDAQHRLLKEAYYAGNGYNTQTSRFAYNAKGEMTEMKMYSSDTFFVLKQLYDYDSRGNRLSLKNYNSSNLLSYEYSYVYDNDNNKIEMRHRVKRDTVARITRYTYNDKKLLVKLVISRNGQTEDSTAYSYSPSGKVVERNSLYPGQRTSITVRYNDHDLEAESLEYKNDALKTRQTWWYEYDTHGNWIRRFNSYNGDSPTLTEREIKYY